MRQAEVSSPVDLDDEPYRSPARRDAARLTHSPAFRRLQGKTQLFPGIESDYFRNRLTHSLEVGQIAKSIAVRLNHTERFLSNDPLDVDLVEFAGWCHDLGHPPFGHQGEEALDKKMRGAGGFEGNAQTLRILARLEKRQHGCSDDSGIDDEGKDCRLGLNLAARTLAAVLKYDHRIPIRRRPHEGVVKGYYDSEKTLVGWIKSQVVDDRRAADFKTVECQIMDLADDIAYSTYDLEDTFKAGFFGPLDMLSNMDVLESVATKAGKTVGRRVDPEEVIGILTTLFGRLVDRSVKANNLILATVVHRAANQLAQSGYLRSQFTSQLIRSAMEGIRFTLNESCPALSSVTLEPSTRLRVEVLKHFTYEATILSPRVKVSQFRAEDIVGTIFDALQADQRLLPSDSLRCHQRIDERDHDRVICDFIAGMTDRYALEFYGRLKSENPQTIFKPL